MIIPKSWNEITISKWKELNSVQSDSELTTLIERISILADRDPSEVRSLPVREFNEISSQLSWLGEDIPNNINLKLEIGGKKYGMIPDLNFISTGEFVDIENWKSDSIQNVHLICALLWRPIIWEDGDDWRIAPHESAGFTKRAELFLNELKITDVWGAILFFSSFGLQFLEIIADYSEEEKKLQNPKMKKKSSTRSRLKKNN